MVPTTFPVTAHTDHVGPGSTFVVIQGYKQDGLQFVPLALQKGATTFVVQHDVYIPTDIQNILASSAVHLQRVENTRKALAQLSAHAYGYPARSLKLIGITGTKGKTSTSFILHHLLLSAGKQAALLSTVHNKINTTTLPTQLTTQQPDYLHAFFAQCVQQGIEYVVMEVAAQALSVQRVHGLEFAGVIFTNFAQEHGEFYATMDDYFAAKCLLFKQLTAGAHVLINADDVAGQKILAAHPEFNAYDKQSDFTCCALVGEFNRYNVSAATRMAHLFGIDADTIQQGLHTFAGVPGRLEQYLLPNGARAFIDYAHNPSSYKAVLSTMRPLTNHLIVVFGAGGERDKTRRPLMGALANDYADCIVLTSDNPRSEDAQAIVNDIMAGIPRDMHHKVSIELDRERAINYAYQYAKPESIIMVLGKGPDEYQIIGNVKSFFSDRQVIQQLQ